MYYLSSAERESGRSGVRGLKTESLVPRVGTDQKAREAARGPRGGRTREATAGAADTAAPARTAATASTATTTTAATATATTNPIQSTSNSCRWSTAITTDGTAGTETSTHHSYILQQCTGAPVGLSAQEAPTRTGQDTERTERSDERGRSRNDHRARSTTATTTAATGGC